MTEFLCFEGFTWKNLACLADQLGHKINLWWRIQDVLCDHHDRIVIRSLEDD